MRSRSLPLFVLLAYGVAFASWALGVSLIGFDDHPGQLYRAWHVVTRGPAPWAWDPGWWGGYPELQFYPPGLAYAVALLHVASGHALSLAASYHALVWLAYLAPAVTAWLVLRRVLNDGWLALPGAFVALTLSAGMASGVEGGVHTGMVPARLAWALLPLVALVLGRGTGGAHGVPWSIVPLVACVALTHPAHLPAAVALVILAAWLAPSGRLLALGGPAAALALAAGLTAFWSVPLLAHLAHTRALAWGALSARELFGHPLASVLLGLAAVELTTRLRSRDDQPPLAAMLSAFPWIMLGIVLVDAVGLEPLGVRWLPADRVADSAWLAFVLSGGATAGRLLAGLAGHRAQARPALALGAVALAVAIGLPTGTLTAWPPARGWERYATIERGVRLGALWSALRAAPAGRVLFVRSGVPLVYGTDWWRPHSHVTALTPLAAGRDIVNGTFTHPSPLAAFVYRGDAEPGAIRELVERLDGHRLFGRDLAELDADTFNRYADRLGVATVVALDEDVPRLRALRDNPRISPAAPSPPFVIYARDAGPAPPHPVGPGRLRLSLDAAPGSWVPARMAYYPLWRATSDGHAVAVRRGEMADLEVRSPRPGAEIDLVYARGFAETSGLVLSALSLVTLAVLWIAQRRRRPPGPIAV